MSRHGFLAVGAVVVLVCGFITAGATPKEAVGFWGTVTGKVGAAKADGSSFTLTVSKAEPDESKSKVKDGSPLVGKEIALGVRMPRKDGKPTQSTEDIAYIKTLKPGMVIKVKIFAVMADPTVLRIQGPGETVSDESK